MKTVLTVCGLPKYSRSRIVTRWQAGCETGSQENEHEMAYESNQKFEGILRTWPVAHHRRRVSFEAKAP
jgi:hypothetical protein